MRTEENDISFCGAGHIHQCPFAVFPRGFRAKARLNGRQRELPVVITEAWSKRTARNSLMRHAEARGTSGSGSVSQASVGFIQRSHARGLFEPGLVVLAALHLSGPFPRWTVRPFGREETGFILWEAFFKQSSMHL